MVGDANVETCLHIKRILTVGFVLEGVEDAET